MLLRAWPRLGCKLCLHLHGHAQLAAFSSPCTRLRMELCALAATAQTQGQQMHVFAAGRTVHNPNLNLQTCYKQMIEETQRSLCCKQGASHACSYYVCMQVLKMQASVGVAFMPCSIGRCSHPTQPVAGKNEGLFCCGTELDEDRKSTRLNSSHSGESRMPSSA